MFALYDMFKDDEAEFTNTPYYTNQSYRHFSVVKKNSKLNIHFKLCCIIFCQREVERDNKHIQIYSLFCGWFCP